MELHTDYSIFAPRPRADAKSTSLWFQNAEQPSLALKLLRTVEQFRTRPDDRYAQELADLRTLGRLLKSEGVLETARVHTARYNDAPMFCTCSVLPHYPEGATDGHTRTTALGNGFGECVPEAAARVVKPAAAAAVLVEGVVAAAAKAEEEKAVVVAVTVLSPAPQL